MSARLGIAGLLATAVLLGGCGEGGAQDDAEPTGYEAALGSVGEGVSPSGTGFGWIDLGAARNPRSVALALGPGPSSFVATPRQLRRLGVGVAEAEQATSVAASYGYGVRLDGVDGRRLERQLRAAGAKPASAPAGAPDATDPSGEWTELDLGAEWQRPSAARLAPLRDYAARVAISDEALILSRTASGRRALEGGGADAQGALSEPANRFAAECLGQVSSARTLPGSFTHNPFASPELIAVGVSALDPRREILCAIGGDPETAAGWSQALEQSFAAEAREPLLGTPIDRAVAGAAVEQIDDESAGLHAARAEIELAARAEPGWIYGALVRGSVLPLVGAPAPTSEGNADD